MQKITPFLWFNGQAEEAALFYTSVFNNASITGISRYGASGPGSEGSVMSVSFVLEGQQFHALNGGPAYSFTPAISFFVNCETQEELDSLWNQLLEGGEAQRCGWLQDRYGVSWQIIPSVLGVLLGDSDPARSARVMKAMMGMVKIEIRELQDAYHGA